MAEGSTNDGAGGPLSQQLATAEQRATTAEKEVAAANTLARQVAQQAAKELEKAHRRLKQLRTEVKELKTSIATLVGERDEARDEAARLSDDWQRSAEKAEAMKRQHLDVAAVTEDQDKFIAELLEGHERELAKLTRERDEAVRMAHTAADLRDQAVTEARRARGQMEKLASRLAQSTAAAQRYGEAYDERPPPPPKQRLRMSTHPPPARATRPPMGGAQPAARSQPPAAPSRPPPPPPPSGRPQPATVRRPGPASQPPRVTTDAPPASQPPTSEPPTRPRGG